MEREIPRQCKANRFYCCSLLVANECCGHSSRLCCPHSCTLSCHMVLWSIWSTSAAQSGTKPLGALYEAEGQSTGGTTAVFAARQLLQPPASLAGQNEWEKIPSCPIRHESWLLSLVEIPNIFVNSVFGLLHANVHVIPLWNMQNMMHGAMIWSACVFESLFHALVQVLNISDSLFEVNRANLSAWFTTSTSDKYDLTCSRLVRF